MPKAILVLDDAQGSLAPLADILVRSGYGVTALGEGADGVAAFTETRAELVFISLDGHDGGATCDAIRADPDGAIVPIVLVGERHPGVRSASDALSLGADFYFERPLELGKVLAKVQTYVGAGDTPLDLAALSAPAAPASHDVVPKPAPAPAPAVWHEPEPTGALPAAPSFGEPPPRTLAPAADDLLGRLHEQEEAERRARAERDEAEAHARRQLEAEAQALREAEERAQRDNEERARRDAELEERRRAEAMARRRDEGDVQPGGERAAAPRIDQERLAAQLRAEIEAKLRAEQEAAVRAREEAEQRVVAEADLRRQVEEEVRQRMGLPAEPRSGDGVLARATARAGGLVSKLLGRSDADEQPETPAAAPARPLPSGMVALEPAESLFGDTRDLADVMAQIIASGVTGRVDFLAEGRQKSVFFERGVPVDAYSSQVFDRMEEYLLREGKITRAQYQETRVKGLKGPRKIGAYLVSSAYLKPQELFEAVRGHLVEIYCGVFELDSGSYRYLPERALDDDRVTLAQDPRALLIEALRRKYLVPRLMKRIGGPSTLLALRPGVTVEADGLGLSREEGELVRLVDGTRNVEDIVFSSGLDALRVYQVLVALVVLGYAVVLVRGLESASKEGVLTADAIDKDRITDKIEQIRQLDYFQILGVAKNATPYEIDKAFERNLTEFDPTRFSPIIQHEMFEELSEIGQVLADARDVLRDDALRDAYARHLPG